MTGRTTIRCRRLSPLTASTGSARRLYPSPNLPARLRQPRQAERGIYLTEVMHRPEGLNGSMMFARPTFGTFSVRRVIYGCWNVSFVPPKKVSPSEVWHVEVGNPDAMSLPAPSCTV